jgi:phage host-nuclease inhibitor protein Gam
MFQAAVDLSDEYAGQRDQVKADMTAMEEHLNITIDAQKDEIAEMGSLLEARQVEIVRLVQVIQ